MRHQGLPSALLQVCQSSPTCLCVSVFMDGLLTCKASRNTSIAMSILNSKSPGPKGVINDWRKFKLESMDQDSLPPSKRELLRQMSSTKPQEGGQDRGHRKVSQDMHKQTNHIITVYIRMAYMFVRPLRFKQKYGKD